MAIVDVDRGPTPKNFTAGRVWAIIYKAHKIVGLLDENFDQHFD